LELTRGEDIDRLCWKDDEGVNHSELLDDHRNSLVARLFELDGDGGETRTKTANEEVVRLVRISRAGVGRAELLDDVLALGDGPVEVEAVH